MKKKYIYFVVPVVGLAVFILYYLQFTKEYDRKQDEKRAAAEAVIEKKAADAEAARLKAVLDAKATHDKNVAEKKAREALEDAHRVAIQDAKDQYERVQRDDGVNQRQCERLEAQVKVLLDDIDRLERKRTENVAEAAFLKDFIVIAQDKLANLNAVVEKIDKADKEAARQAKILAAKNNS